MRLALNEPQRSRRIAITVASVVLSIAAAGLTGVAGCAQTTGGGGGADMAVCELAVCHGGCDVDTDCKAGLKCDPANHHCVACVSSGDCPNGAVCSPMGMCVPGCSPTHGCGSDGGVCEGDAGMCVQCLADTDCPMDKPRCDPTAHRCFPCNPLNDNCGHAQYCAGDPMAGFLCAGGCKDDKDCRDPGSDDGGASGDGGVGGGGLNRCDAKGHQCVRCLADGDCPLGKLCTGFQCVDGCNGNHGCPPSLSCCNGACSDTTADFMNCGACGKMCSGGWNCCNSVCANPTNDVQNCNGCGTTCTVLNGTPACTARQCAIAMCNAGYKDCNGQYLDGCETNTDVNINNCGACNNPCSITHATPRCAGGACLIDTCIPPYQDCNNMVKDGCETNVMGSDVGNCGGCMVACTIANGSPICDMGVCKVSACLKPFDDCNHDPKDGCETDTTLSVPNCGGCGLVCAPAHAAPNCANGRCTIGTCDAGFADCDSTPADGCEISIATDVNNCGACARVCSTNNGTPSCLAGACKITCNTGYVDCNGMVADGCEINKNTDVNNCGGCAKLCVPANATPSCSNGACVIGRCNAGWADCNNDPSDGCEVNIAADPLHCGSCQKTCSTANGTAGCANFLCTITCAAGYGNCNNDASDGCEVNLNTDVRNCSGCGTTCSLANATPACTAGACVIAGCMAGFADCDLRAATGCEINTNTDTSNCNACGHACSTQNGTASCAAGACSISCAAGFANCNNDVTDGCEVNLNTDVRNCGGCSAACSPANATPTCTNGACRIATCNTGYADCNGDPRDGCEINLNTDVANCGACKTVCSNNHGSPSCTAGACQITCTPPYEDCDGNVANGCEVNLGSDTANCGKCSTACSANNIATLSCTNGKCDGACSPGFLDCDGNKQANGCEVNGKTDATNCGGCGNTCSNQNIATPTCAAGACNGACDAGFADCNNNKLVDGCEVNIAGTVANCGGCGTVCSTNNIAAACAGGSCGAGVCNAGYADCNNNKQTDGCEINVAADVANCGGCGTLCSTNNIARSCSGGSCSGGSCLPGFADCNMNKQTDGCEINIAGDVTNCGACGTACSTNNVARACTGGSCAAGTCNTGYADCNNNKQADGCEINVAGDTSNCGGCGTVCSGNNVLPSCTGGSCQAGMCLTGFADCNMNKQLDGCEVNTNTDEANCGGCGTGCSTQNITRSCVGGSCEVGVCAVGYTDCNNNKRADGCEVNTGGDVNNCGGCATVCSGNNISRACSGGSCSAGTCSAGYTDCNNNKQLDGCEVNTGGDVSNCGGCGSPCSTSHVTRTCSLGSCEGGSCDAGYTDCNNNKRADGCETHTAADLNNCGTCGHVCQAVANAAIGCGGGTCGITSCSADYYDANGAYADGCECNAPDAASTCAAAEDLGTIAFGGLVSVTARLPAGSPGVHWYRVAFANQVGSASFHPSVGLTMPTNYRLDVYSDCAGTTYGCRVEGGRSSGLTQWEVAQTAGDPTTDGAGPNPDATAGSPFVWAVPNPGASVYVRVTPMGNVACDAYTLTAQNR